MVARSTASSSYGIGQCRRPVVAAVMIASSLAVVAVFNDAVVLSQLSQSAWASPPPPRPKGAEVTAARVTTTAAVAATEAGAKPATAPKPSPEPAARSPAHEGLPLLTQAPPWLLAEDGLVIDARANSTTTMGGGILIAVPVIPDSRHKWKGGAKRPAWLRAAIATNRLHGHAMVIRPTSTLMFPPPWQDGVCDKKGNAQKIENCWRTTERDNIIWEKEQIMVDYLESPQNFSHVLVLDTDAVLVNHNLSVLEEMAQVLENSVKEVFLTDEDWIGAMASGANINSGVLFARNSPWALGLFRDMLDSRWYGPAGFSTPRTGGGHLPGCVAEEQTCINSLRNRKTFNEHVVVMPGTQYNCGLKGDVMKRFSAEDPTLKVLHFMGPSKSSAARTLCAKGKSMTGDGPTDYGCSP